jgi:hypothetical protein
MRPCNKNKAIVTDPGPAERCQDETQVLDFTEELKALRQPATHTTAMYCDR